MICDPSCWSRNFINHFMVRKYSRRSKIIYMPGFLLFRNCRFATSFKISFGPQLFFIVLWYFIISIKQLFTALLPTCIVMKKVACCVHFFSSTYLENQSQSLFPKTSANYLKSMYLKAFITFFSRILLMFMVYPSAVRTLFNKHKNIYRANLS